MGVEGAEAGAATAAGNSWSSSKVAIAVAIAPALGALLAHAILIYAPFFEDDGFISLRYASRLLHGHGLTWSGDERVEGYSNFLWVVLVAAATGATRADPVLVARALGLTSAAAATAAVCFANLPRRRGELLPVLACGLALAMSTPVAVWAIGGLEEPLVAALAVWGIVLAYPAVESDPVNLARLGPAGICFAFAAITRADGLVFGLAASAGFALAGGLRRRAWAGAFRLLAPAFAFVFLHVAFRRIYYQAWVPNTYHAKFALGWGRVHAGWSYLTRHPAPLAGLLVLGVPAVVAAVRDPVRRRRVVFAATPLIAWAAYVVLIGGDTMSAQRHLVPLFFLTALLDSESLAWLGSHTRAGTMAAHAAALTLVGWSGWAAWEDPDRDRTLAERWEWSGQSVGLFLERAFGDRHPLLAVDAAGATPYFAETLDAIDMLGLNDRYLATHPPADMGSGPLGHELGDGAYMLRRKPDIVLFHVPPGQAQPRWRGGIEMTSSPAFHQLYTLVQLNTRGPRRWDQAIVWVRSEDGRIGIERGPDRVLLPGFLLASPGVTLAELDGAGRLGVLIAPGQTLPPFRLEMPAGRWRAAIDAEGRASVAVAFEGAERPASGDDAVSFTLPRTSTVSVAVTSDTPSSIHLRTLLFTRESP